MIERDFISYEFALKLIAVGFNEPSFAYYGEINGGEINLFITTQKLQRNFPQVVAPTTAQAIYWLNKHIDKLDINLKSEQC